MNCNKFPCFLSFATSSLHIMRTSNLPIEWIVKKKRNDFALNHASRRVLLKVRQSNEPSCLDSCRMVGNAVLFRDNSCLVNSDIETCKCTISRSQYLAYFVAAANDPEICVPADVAAAFQAQEQDCREAGVTIDLRSVAPATLPGGSSSTAPSPTAISTLAPRTSNSTSAGPTTSQVRTDPASSSLPSSDASVPTSGVTNSRSTSNPTSIIVSLPSSNSTIPSDPLNTAISPLVTFLGSGDEKQRSASDIGAIIGGTMGLLALLASLIFLAGYIRRRRWRLERNMQGSPFFVPRLPDWDSKKSKSSEAEVSIDTFVQKGAANGYEYPTKPPSQKLRVLQNALHGAGSRTSTAACNDNQNLILPGVVGPQSLREGDRPPSYSERVRSRIASTSYVVI
ncbi:hypothetical protein BJ165DRAFT_1449012 [Panaeolus papilionaceus]|nr:hypothetical protein BJ165DRAFT_1449012 [Panaeolus papilionaceus]